MTGSTPGSSRPHVKVSFLETCQSVLGQPHSSATIYVQQKLSLSRLVSIVEKRNKCMKVEVKTMVQAK